MFNYYNTQQGLLKVNGIESARMYPTSPNSTLALFENDDDIFYFVQTDASNFKTIRRFRFIEEPIETTNNAVSKDEITALHKEIEDVKQSIQQLADAVSARSGKPKHKPNGEQPSNFDS